jgi:hypothetical protein
MFRPKKSLMINILKWSFLIIFVAITLINLRQMYTSYVDDAFIFLRYANNIAHGYGFVWNPGSAPVEGYTSFLFLMLLVIIRLLGFTSISANGWLGIISSAIALLLTWKLVETILPGKPLVWIIVYGVVGAAPILISWTTEGLDITFYTAILLSATLAYLLSNEGKVSIWVVGLLFTLLALARPEGILLFGITGIFEIIRNFRLERKIFFRRLILLILPFLLIYVPYFIWRWSYFGYIFPNTYYDKTGAGLIQIKGGLVYWWQSINGVFGLSLILLAVSLLFIPLIRSRKVNPKIAYLVLVVLSIWGYVVMDGGDHFSGGRFILPSIPFLVILAASGFLALYQKNRLTLILAGLALVLMAYNSFKNPEYTVIRHHLGDAFKARTVALPAADPKYYQILQQYDVGFAIMGNTLKKVVPANESIAVTPIGAIGYYSNLTVFDMLGVVDPVISHEPFDPVYIATWRPGHDKGDGKYILSLHPDYIELLDYLTSKPMAEPDSNMLQYKSVFEIWNDPEFHAEYEFHPLAVGNGWYYNLYRRKGSDRFQNH